MLKGGVCIYCGQNHMVDVPAEIVGEDLNYCATMQCSCADARREQKIHKSIEQSKTSIRELMGNNFPEVTEILLKCAEHIKRDVIDKLTIVVDNTKFQLSTNSDGTLKIEKNTTLKQRKDV